MKGTVNIQIFKGTHVKKKTKSAWSIWNPRHLDQQTKALVWIVVQCGFGQSPVSIWICDVNPYVSSLKFKSQRCSYTRCINLSSWREQKYQWISNQFKWRMTAVQHYLKFQHEFESILMTGLVNCSWASISIHVYRSL